ncbi:50S ribosomal protein L24 [Candidatus Roizmanbacteria bacterium CG_4_10_14_0_2_um_filter_36_35]|uniref:Large ribosomal subunit protein uL24 n=4 Tax=Candidatus Roizmaniibacteriota TaxID=1752723 RepID=A0A2M7BXI8_9BACT|nr:MAG: 50S ribosomal protein L24 [Candidatus Roizmanbacteria bacterium CG11_big_fil_rev_8_21_14_0_20_35_14]PIV11287.1 MAG: 50S ribosomal protein L24 [Candidatus Roizmanbacteria bacterium CG03_land_8_20_14_0_80_35_26]PIZ67400.1 MAG: 50S ribosomal protein L24 [Candidatus Roizmanbacteria bacterium CG_4_10_14_0_2_um_filter_36_35]PJC32960.1 MAG: 50S ribosomal protein L24 [Candidatus Roizmanbacteria bacterium CG_4_9_14_0_2_um_filter_36_12]PJC80474.1 MAG: 50S ribosomal protein L24 [Candidatus Roizman
MKIKKGDKVRVMAGKDKGREGKVEKVYKKSNKILIPNINIYKRHVKKSDKMPQGGIVDVPRPLDVAKIMLICPKCGKMTRIGFKVEKDKKLRVCKKCESKI